MIKEIPINEPHILAIRISGKLVDEDYTQFVPRLERLLEKEKKLSLLIKLEDFEGWSAKAAWEDIKIGISHEDDLLRIGIVGEKRWQKFMATFGNLFTDTNVRYFDDESSALEWLKEIQNKVEQDEYQGYRHVLVASDYSSYSLRALNKAVELATPFNAKITVLHVAETLSAEIYPTLGELSIPVMAGNPELEKKQLSRLERELDEFIKDVDYPHITSEIEIGRPAETILEYAFKHDADLIVVGSHNRKGLAKLMGSSTNGIISNANCDVLVTVDI